MNKFLNGKMHGVQKMVAKIKAYQAQFPDKVKAALYLEGQVEMTEAKRRCPVWNSERPVPFGHAPGSLRASGHVEEPVRNGSRISVALTFGTDYAIFVHEDLEAFHETGEAKYLEGPLVESAPYIPARLAARIKS